MRNRFLTVFIALMLCCMLVTSAALADYSATALYTGDSAHLVIVANSVFSYDGDRYILLDEAGNVIGPEEGFTKIEIASYFYQSTTSFGDTFYPGFEVTNDDGQKGFLLPDGTMAVPCGYADILVYSDLWQIGVTVHVTEEGEEKDYDNWQIKGFGDSGDQSWTITQADVYYGGSLCFTVDSKEFSRSSDNRAFGDYICITDRDGKYVWFGKNGSKTNDGTDSSFFEYRNRTHIATGTEAFAEGCALTGDEVYACHAYDSASGDILALNGQVLGNVSEDDRQKYNYTVSAFRGDYFTLAGSVNDVYTSGLFDLSGALVIGDIPGSAIRWTDEWLSVEDSSDSNSVRIGFAPMTAGSTLQYYDAGSTWSSIYGSWACYADPDNSRVYHVVTATAGLLDQTFSSVIGMPGADVFTAVRADDDQVITNLYDLNGSVILEDVGSVSYDGTLAVVRNYDESLSAWVSTLYRIAEVTE